MVPGFMTRFNQEDQIVLLKRGKGHFLTTFGDVLFCPDCFFVRIHTIIIWSHETKAFDYYGNCYLDMYLQWKTFNFKASKSVLKPLKITLCFTFHGPKSAKSQCCFYFLQQSNWALFVLSKDTISIKILCTYLGVSPSLVHEVYSFWGYLRTLSLKFQKARTKFCL